MTLTQQETEQEVSTMVPSHAQEMQQMLKVVQVHFSVTEYCKIAKMNVKSCLSLVEGLWSTWDPWSTCHGTCDNDAKHNRSRSFVGGNIPCSGNATEEGSCTGSN